MLKINRPETIDPSRIPGLQGFVVSPMSINFSDTRWLFDPHRLEISQLMTLGLSGKERLWAFQRLGKPVPDFLIMNALLEAFEEGQYPEIHEKIRRCLREPENSLTFDGLLCSPKGNPDILTGFEMILQDGALVSSTYCLQNGCHPGNYAATFSR